MITVIEVSCGEYGDNTRNLVNAIENGKRDIRTGYVLPEVKPEALNNAAVANDSKSVDLNDKNDANNTVEKFQTTKNNGGAIGYVIPGYATNDIPKQSE